MHTVCYIYGQVRKSSGIIFDNPCERTGWKWYAIIGDMNSLKAVVM